MPDPLIKYDQSTGILEATLTDADGDAVTDATITVTISDRAGTDLVTGASAPHDSGGVYKYTIADDLLPLAGAMYLAKVTAVSGSNQRYAERTIHNKLDRT